MRRELPGINDLRARYNGFLSQHAMGTPERAAYLQVYYVLRRCNSKSQTVAPLHKLLDHAPDDVQANIYREAWELLKRGQ